jgi:hypothetical protein
VDSPLTGWLKDLTPQSCSFLLFSSGAQPVQAVVAFGLPCHRSCPSVRSEIANTVRWMALATCCAEEVRRLSAELATVNERLRQRKLVERAKARLQAEHGYTEQEAYEHLRKLSRQRRVPMADIALAVVGS